MSLIIQPKLSMAFQPEQWNAPDVVGQNNCLAYALDEFGLGWPFKNFRAAFDPALHRLRDVFLKRAEGQRMRNAHYFGILFRLAGFERIRPNQYDPSTRHIIAFSPLRDHFYRLDADGTWSHKPGLSEASNRDDKGNIIESLERSEMKRLPIWDNERINEERSFALSRYRRQYQDMITEYAQLTPEQRKELGIESEFQNAIALIRNNKKPVVSTNDEFIYLAMPPQGIEIMPKDSARAPA